MADNKKSSISKRSSCYLINLKQPDKTAKRLKLSFQRTAATVTILKADRHVDGSVGFLDVSETGAGIFTPELLHKGAHVELAITEPAPLKVRGIVAWSIPVTSGIHAGRFKCRSGIQFVLDGEEQIKAVQEFIRKAGQDPVENFRSSVMAAAEAARNLEAANAAQPPSTAEAAAMAAMAATVAPAAPPSDPAMPMQATQAAPAPAEAPAAEAALAPAVAEAPAAETPSGENPGDSGQQAA